MDRNKWNTALEAAKDRKFFKDMAQAAPEWKKADARRAFAKANEKLKGILDELKVDGVDTSGVDWYP